MFDVSLQSPFKTFDMSVYYTFHVYFFYAFINNLTPFLMVIIFLNE